VLSTSIWEARPEASTRNRRNDPRRSREPERARRASFSYNPRPMRALLLLLLGLALGCSPEVELVESEEVLLTLFDRDAHYDVVTENERWPVRVDLMRPGSGVVGDAGVLAALEVTPPCKLRFKLPELPSGARLYFANAILANSYRDLGEVQFEWTLDGEVMHSSSLSAARDVPEEARKWYRANFELESGAELVLTTRAGTQGPAPPRVAVGRIEVRVPYLRERAPATASTPNVILVVIDTLRSDGLSCYGNDLATSPAIDALAARGARFDRAYVPAPWTIPSTTSILTGLVPPRHGTGITASNYVAGEHETLAEIAQRNGLATGAFSANPLIADGRNFSQGFETFYESAWDRAADMQPAILDWITQRANERFFLYLHLVEPHYPYQPETEFKERFESAPPEGFKELSHKDFMRSVWSGAEYTPDYLDALGRYKRDLYNGEVASVDHVLSRVRAKLTELGIAETTLIGITSDHGEEFFDHGLLGHKLQLHEELVRVPLILAGPGVRPGQVVDERVEARFIGPTLFRLAGIESNLEGPNLLSPAERGAAARDRLFFSTSEGRFFNHADNTWHDARAIHGVLDGHWLFFWSPKEPKRDFELVNLFHLEDDPEARKDVSAEHPRLVRNLKRAYQNWATENKKLGASRDFSSEAELELLKSLGYVGDDDSEDE